MVHKFQAIPVQPAKTLAEQVHEMRTFLGLDLYAVAQKIGVRHEYLAWLESGHYEKMPADIYVKGFLKRYGDVLRLDGQQLFSLYQHEVAAMRTTEEPAVPAVLPKVSWSARLWRLVPRFTWRTAVVAAMVLLMVGVGTYLGIQLNHFGAHPTLTVTTPTDRSTVHESQLTLRGRVDQGAHVAINGVNVAVASDGSFAQPLQLQQGVNTLQIVAENRFHKTTTHTMQILLQQNQQLSYH